MLDMITETDSRAHCEESDSYRGELFRLGRYRVAVCRDGLQWLYQRQGGQFKTGGARWRTLGYCVTRNALTGLHRAANDSDAPEIARLPATFSRAVAQ